MEVEVIDELLWLEIGNTQEGPLSVQAQLGDGLCSVG